MSSRLMRKIKKENDLVDNNNSSSEEEDQDSSEDDDGHHGGRKAAVASSSFSMLGLSDGSDNEDEQSDEEEELEEEEPKPKQTKASPPLPSSSTSNKKKKNNKKKGGQQQQQQPAKQPQQSSKNKKKKNNNNSLNKQLDELVDSINEKSSNSTSTTSTSSSSTSSIFSDPTGLKDMIVIESKNLNPTNELKKMLGCKVSDMKEVEKNSKQPNNPYYNINTQLAKKKHLLFVSPKPEWPPLLNPLSMEVDRVENGITYYRLKWSESYRRVQEDFLTVLSTHDPSMIAELLRFYPYHIDSLLQLSQVCLQTADFAHAGDFVERAVFAFECSFHHNFNPLHGTSRFEYKVPDNKTGFLSIFRHIQILGRRGCPRTALEYCKMLLSFDYNDPLYVRLIIDFYSLRSKQYGWLVDFYRKVKKIGNQSIDLLPNFCYSASLAKYLQEKSQGVKHDESNQWLQNALIRFPMLLRPLIQKLKTTLLTINPATGKPFNLEEHAYFVDSEDKLKPIQHLATLYVERNHQLWDSSPDIMNWVKDNVKLVIERVEKKDPIIGESMNQVLKEYSVIDQNIFDHLFLSEYSDVIQRLPPDVIEVMRREGFNNIEQPQGIDPRRVGQGFQVYRRQPRQQQQQQQQQLRQQQQLIQQQIQQQQQQQQQQQPLIQENPDYHPLLHFVRTLLPFGQGGGDQQQQEQAQRGFLDDYIDVIYEDEEQDEE